MRERIDLTEDDGASLVLLLTQRGTAAAQEKTRYMLPFSTCLCSVTPAHPDTFLPPPPPLRSELPLLPPRSPNARTVFTPRETRRDRMCGGRTEGDCVSVGSLQKHCEWRDMGGAADQTGAGPADNAPTSLIAIDFAADR